MNNPLVSIITVTYNAQEYLEQTMQSVFAQTYPNIEYLIIDGGSTDGTISIINGHESKLSLWISEKDNGIYDAMNKGIGKANGELIGMINAGDCYEPNAVEQVVNAYLKSTDCGIFHGNINMLNSDGSFFKLKKPNPDMSELYKGISFFHSTFFVQNSVYKKHGTYDTTFKVSADFDFGLRCYLADIKFGYIDQVLADFRLGGFSSLSGKQGMYECRDILLKNGYEASVVLPIFKKWEKSYKKKRIMDAGYGLLRKILPLSVLNRLSNYMSIK